MSHQFRFVIFILFTFLFLLANSNFQTFVTSAQQNQDELKLEPKELTLTGKDKTDKTTITKPDGGKVDENCADFKAELETCKITGNELTVTLNEKFLNTETKTIRLKVTYKPGEDGKDQSKDLTITIPPRITDIEAKIGEKSAEGFDLLENKEEPVSFKYKKDNEAADEFFLT